MQQKFKIVTKKIKINLYIFIDKYKKYIIQL